MASPTFTADGTHAKLLKFIDSMASPTFTADRTCAQLLKLVCGMANAADATDYAVHAFFLDLIHSMAYPTTTANEHAANTVAITAVSHAAPTKLAVAAAYDAGAEQCPYDRKPQLKHGCEANRPAAK